ncbi:MAG: archaetidylserine decarboxylase [Rhodanobacteraceae bacterium]
MTPATFLQYVMPHHALSRLVRHATRWTWRPWKDFLIGRVVRKYQVDMTEAAQPDARAYASFNAFFTRALRAGVRHAAGDGSVMLCPADGRISQAGAIVDGRILQAKGRTYTVAELLADEAAARAYHGGAFATVYLSPRDYHRVHMPLDGELIETVQVPGRIFSVAPGPVADIPRLFARNERLVCHFEGERGPFVVAMVGAILVSGITTAWNGAEVPPYRRTATRRDWRGRGIRLARFAEMARFEMGSTVIVLVPRGRIDAHCAPEAPVKVGECIGHLSPAGDHGTIPPSGGDGRIA